MQNPPFPVSDYKAAFMLNSTNLTVTASAPFPVSTYDAVWMLNPPSAGGTVPDYSNGGTMNGPLIVHPKITTDLIESTNGTVDTLSSNYISNSQNIGTRTLAATYSVTAPSATITSVSSTNSNTQNLTSTVSSNLTNLNCVTGHISNLTGTTIVDKLETPDASCGTLIATTGTVNNLTSTTANIGTETVGTLTSFTKIQGPSADITNITSNNVASVEVNAGDIFLDHQLLASTYSTVPHIDINGIIKTKLLRAYDVQNPDDPNFGVNFNKIISSKIFADEISTDKLLPVASVDSKIYKYTSTSTSIDICTFTQESGYVDFDYSVKAVYVPSIATTKQLSYHYVNVTKYQHYCLRYHIYSQIWLDGTTPVYPYLLENMSDVAQHGTVNSFVNYDPVWDNKNYNLYARPIVTCDNSGNISVDVNTLAGTRMMFILRVNVSGFYW